MGRRFGNVQRVWICVLSSLSFGVFLFPFFPFIPDEFLFLTIDQARLMARDEKMIDEFHIYVQKKARDGNFAYFLLLTF